MSFHLPCRQTCWFVVSIVLAGCGDDRQPPELSFDQQVEQQWMEGRERVDAVEYLESGGIYENTSSDLKIDQEHLLPLLKKLQDDFGLTVEALLDPDNKQIAFAIVVDVSDRASHPDIVAAIEEAERDLPGLVQDYWGDHWLSIDIMDDFETKMLGNDGHLELLRKHLTAQRARIREAAK